MSQHEPQPMSYPSATTSTTPDADERKQMGRRALIAAAGLGVVGIAAAEAPKILDAAGDLTKKQIEDAINLGRQELAKELVNIEEIGIDVAVDVADITHNAVNLFVVPIAGLVTALTEVTLDVAIGTIDKVHGAAGLVGLDIQALDQLGNILKSWKVGVAQFPAAVKSINNVETSSAKTYLSGLKQKLEREASGGK